MKYEGGGSFGDLKKYVVKCNDKDITNLVVHAEIYMDVFFPSWSAKLYMIDTENLIMRMPLRQGDNISIEIESGSGSAAGDGTKTYNFVLYAIIDRKMSTAKVLTYTANLVTQNLISDTNTRISKAYPNKKPEDIIKNILGETIGGSVDAFKSTQSYHLIVPNWSPLTAALWVAKFALYKGAADYLFFMKDEGSYWFKPLERLFKYEESGVTFKLKPSNITERGNGDYEDPKEDFCTIITNHFIHHYDSLVNSLLGFYKHKTVSYNFTQQKWNESAYTYGQDNKEDSKKTSWDKGAFGKVDQAATSFFPVSKNHENFTINDNIDLWFPSRRSNIMKLEQDKLTIQVAGGVKLWELLGMNVDIDLPAHQDLDDTLKFDKHLAGKYVVVAIAQIVTKDYYMVNIELIKKRHSKKMENEGDLDK